MFQIEVKASGLGTLKLAGLGMPDVRLLGLKPGVLVQKNLRLILAFGLSGDLISRRSIQHLHSEKAFSPVGRAMFSEGI